MTRQWVPGDVAMIHGVVAMRFEYSHLTCPTLHKFDGDHWHRADGVWIVTGADDDARPLVVIDPEDREQVERLAEAYCSANPNVARMPSTIADRLTNALREFADPKPPKPAEPTGLGAVVEVHGQRWVYTGDRDLGGQWWYSKADPARWDEFDSVTTLTEGVTA